MTDCFGPRVLITTFDTWLPHQKSNASDDLILALEGEAALPQDCQVLHRLPVDVDAAFEVIQVAVQEHSPDYIFCCGMAEGRSRLNFELQARCGDQVRRSPVPESCWNSLRTRWRCAELSEDAGRFVCNGLYFRLLDEREQLGNPQVLFVHVPLLTEVNRADLMADFQLLLQRLLTGTGGQSSTVALPWDGHGPV